jgi:hypothetical protein
MPCTPLVNPERAVSADDVTIETTPLDHEYDRILVTIPTTAPRISVRLRL